MAPEIQQHQVREANKPQTLGELLNVVVDKVPKSQVSGSMVVLSRCFIV